MSATTVRYLDPDALRIWRPEGSAHLRIEIKDDRTILSAIVRHCFPQSETERFLSIQDEKGEEVGVLKEPLDLDEPAQELVRSELQRRYFTPRIEGIDSLKQEAGMWHFAVRTQRGATAFYVRNWRDSAHEIHPGRWQINSVDGQRFEIQNVEALDGRSRSLLEQLG